MSGIPREELPGAPMVCVGEGPHYWTAHKSHASIRYVSHDKGKTWEKVSATWAAERARRDEEALEMQRIQRELK